MHNASIRAGLIRMNDEIWLWLFLQSQSQFASRPGHWGCW